MYVEIYFNTEVISTTLAFSNILNKQLKLKADAIDVIRIKLNNLACI